MGRKALIFALKILNDFPKLFYKILQVHYLFFEKFYPFLSGKLFQQFQFFILLFHRSSHAKTACFPQAVSFFYCG